MKLRPSIVFVSFFRISKLILLPCFLFFFLCISANLFAQDWIMPVEGKVFAGNQKLAGAVITLYRDNKQLQQVVTTSNGKFSFDLPPNAEYLITVTKAGYITKKFKISTRNVPPDRAAGGNFNPFQPDVTLFEMPTNPEIAKRTEAILSQPIAIYQYVPGEENFNYDEKYTQSIQTKLTELGELQKQAEKELAEKAKKEALEAQKQKELDKKYKDAIAQADKFFGSKDYANAKAGYHEARNLKPAEEYPKTKLAEIAKLLADADAQKQKDQKYKDLITKADGLFNSNDYSNAKTTYQQALGIKPNELYPKQKISDIDKLLANASKQKEIDEKYKSAIAKGDNFFNAKNYASAKTSFTEASSLKPAEQYPKTKLAEIDKLISLAEADKQKEQQYNDLIAKGNQQFVAREYSVAKTAFTQALALKPTEQYPKTKIAEIDKLLSEMAKAGELAQKYKELISKADNLFAQKNYPSARTVYEEASALKSTEQYPKTKIAEIDKILADASKQELLETKYKAAIEQGNQSFASKDYSSARSFYVAASSLKPAESYPKQKISEIDKILGDLAAKNSARQELENNYLGAVSRGDIALKEKNYFNAKAAYKEALTYKPNEEYPQNKIAEIEKLESERMLQQAEKEKQLKYNKHIEQGDKSFIARDYKKAKVSYELAHEVKPEEKYPMDRIAQIDRLMKDAQLAANKKKEKETIPVLTEEEKKKQYQSELRAKYPPGVTEEEFTEGTKTILRRVVIRDDFAGIYTKVMHNWGGIYFFRDGVPITEAVFESESK